MRISFRTLVFATFGLALAGLFFLKNVYASLTVAFVLAYLLEPIVGKLEKRKIQRSYAVPLVLVLGFALIITASIAIVPRLVSQVHELLIRLPRLYDSVHTALAPISDRYLGYDVFQEVDKAMQSLGDPAQIVKPLTNLMQGVFAKTLGFVSTVLGFLIIPLMAYYLLMVFPTIDDRLLYFIPKRHHKAFNEIREKLDGVLGGFLRGQLVVSTILSVYYGLAFVVMRLELALVLGLMAGFFNVIPYLGITSVLVLTLLIAFLHGATMGKYIAILVVFGLGMAMEGSFLTPRIVGRKVGLGPLTLLIALLVGSELSGLVGMLLAIPCAAIGRVFLMYFIEHYRASDTFRRT